MQRFELLRHPARCAREFMTWSSSDKAHFLAAVVMFFTGIFGGFAMGYFWNS